MAAEIRVPVKLEVLQNSIAQIKSTLSSLKPESGAWKELQNILRSMTREADSLQSALSKPFSGQHQFTAAEKDVEKIEDALERARIAMGRIKFSDIQLDAGQLASVKEFEKQLQDIQNKAKNFKATLKAELQGSEQWADFLKIDPDAAIHSYDEIVKAVTARVKQIEDESREAAEALRIATDESTRAEATNKFFTAKKALSKESMGTDWDQFFSIDKNGATRFKSGQKNAFYDWMRDNLTITPEQYEEIKSKTITELQKWIQDFDISAIIKDAENKRTAKSDASAQVAQLVADSKKIESLQATLTANQTRLVPNNQELAAETAKVTAEYNAFKTSAENGARATLSAGTAMQQVGAECQTLQNALQRANSAWIQADHTASTLNGMRQAVVNFMGFNQVLNITRQAVREAANHIKELDTVMSRIAIVTDMSTGDLWNQIDTYSNMAQSYGVSIKGAYEVSQIYYQQGLETADVMTLTNETLKLAKISGLDYATTTDYMTTAIRGFKMEMQDAATVVDVYSALAANTAVSQEELAVAMSKTASSMQGVGTTFEEASAMIGTMVAVTRESATNIGSAMKSIASRYGELTKDPMTLVDSEGEALAFNKVDTALQSVGISMRTADGQFRNFTDVILELSDAWDSLDSTQQRYIATQFAGNRQQSRFLALVSNGEMLRQNIEVAESSEDTGTVQALKALDSIESKTEQVKVAYQQFYTTIGAENIWKAGLDGLTNYINMLNTLPKVFGKIPVGALAMIANLVEIIRGLGDSIVEHIANIWQRILPTDGFTKQSNQMQQDATEAGSNVATGYTQGMQQGAGQAQSAGEKLGQSGIEGLKNGAGTHSPSVPATEAGTNVGTGYAQGMESAINLVYEAGQKLGAAGIQGLQDKLQELSSGSLLDQIAGIGKFLDTDSATLSSESKAFLQEQLAIAQQKLDQSEGQAEKVEITDQSISSDAIEVSTSKIQDQINALQELKALRQEINGLEKGSVEYQEKQELFTKKSVDFNKQLADENVKQISWNTGANKIQERIDILQKPLKATAGPAAAITEQARNNAVAAQQRSENANINAQNGAAEAAKQEAQEAAKQAEDAAERAETALEQITVLSEQGQNNSETSSSDSGSSPNNPLFPTVSRIPLNNTPDDYNDYMERQYEDYVTQFSLPEDAFISQINSDTAQDFSLVGVEVQKLHKDISDTIDELVNLGKIGQEAGEKLKSGLTDNWDLGKLQGQLDALRAEKYQDWGKVDAADEEAQAMAAKEATEAEEKHGAAIQKVVGYMREKTDEGDAFGRKLSMIGSAIATITSLIDKSTEGGRAFAGAMTMASGAVKVISGLMQKNPWMALATGIVTIVNGISMMIEDDTERAERLAKEAEEASNKAKIAKADQRSVEKAIKDYDELKEKRYESEEDAEKYQAAVDDITSKFPSLIQGFNDAGEVILNASEMERVLADARSKTAQATYEAAMAEQKKTEDELKAKQKSLKNDADIFEDAFEFTDNLVAGTAGQGNLIYSALGYDPDSFSPENAPALFKNLARAFNGSVGDYTSMDVAGSDNSLSAYLGSIMEAIQESVKNNGESVLGEWGFNNTEDYYRFISHTAAGGGIFDFANWDATLDTASPFLQNLNQIAQLYQAGEFNFENYTAKINQIKTAYDKLQGTLTSETLDEGAVQDAFNTYREALNSIEPYSPLYQLLGDARTYADSLGTSISEYGTLIAKDKAMSKQVASAWVSTMLGDKSVDGNLISIIGNKLASIYTANSDTTWQDAINNNDHNLRSTADTLIKQAQNFQANIDLDSNKKELFTRMTGNMSDYHWTDFEQAFGDTEGWDEISELIQEDYINQASSIRELVQGKIKNTIDKRHEKEIFSGTVAAKLTRLSLDSNDFTIDEQTVLSSILEGYNKLLDKDYFQEAESYITSMLPIFSQIQKITDTDTRNSAFKTLKDNNLATSEGIIAAATDLDQIEGINDSIIENLTIIGNNMLTNIPLAIQSLTDAANTTWKETEKELDKLINGGIEGYEMTDLISRAHDLNVEIKDTDFTTTDSGKLLLAYDKWQDYYTAVTASINNQISNLSTKLSNASQITSKDQLTRANLEEMGIFIESDEAANTDENWEKYQQAISKAASEYLLLQKIPIMMANNLESSQLKAGKFDSIIESLTISEGENAWDRLLQLAAGADLSASENQNKNITTTVKGIQGSINSLINDLLKKGKENIDLSDYEYIDKEKIDLSGRLQDIITRYVKAAGLTIEEANNQIFEAIEKQNSTTDIDLIKDLTFKTGNLVELTEEQFKNLVNTFEIDITTENGSQLVKTFQASLNTLTGKAAMSLESLSDAGIDLQSVDNFATIVNRSVATVFDDVGDSLTKGVELATKGTNKLADAQAFVESYNEVMNTSKTLEDLFSYNTVLDAFALNNTDLHLYLQEQAQQLGYTDKAIQEYIKNQTDSIIQDNIELDKLLEAETKQERSNEANKLFQQIKGLSNYQDISRAAIKSLHPDWNDGWINFTAEGEKTPFEAITTVLESGGQAAVDLLKKIKPEASSDELEAAFNSQINKLNDVMSQVGDLVVGQFVGTEGKLYEILKRAGAIDPEADGIVAKGFSMVEVYAAIYAEMSNTVGATTSGLNDVYAEMLTAQDQANVDITDVLKNASGMTYDTFGKLLARYNVRMEEVFSSEESQMDFGVQRNGYGQVVIANFNEFKKQIQKRYKGIIDENSQEYLDAYSTYVDSQVTKANQDMTNVEKVVTQIKNILSTKIGQSLNVSAITSAFKRAGAEATLVDIAKQYGAKLKDGLLQITDKTDVAGLVQAITNEAAKAHILIPEQLAELTDAIASMLSNITKLIQSGIQGKLSNVDAASLKGWATKNGITNVQFTEISEGLQLTAESLALVYAQMKEISALQAQSLLPDIIASSDKYATLGSTLQAAAESVRNIRFQYNTTFNEATENAQKLYEIAKEAYTGTVALDYSMRPHVYDNEGYVETHHTVTASNALNQAVNITPILPDGTELSQDWAKDIGEKYLNGELTLETKLTGEDGKELDYTLKDVYMGFYETQQAAEDSANAVHEYGAAASEAAAANEELSSTFNLVSAEASMFSDIVLNKLTDASSMNFMSDSLPENFQVAINAWENASKAINTLTTAGKNGYIGVEDFYNIVNTSAGLLEAAGKEFNVKGMNAAELIEAAGKNLVVVDGDLKVDLSNTGLDMVSGVDDLKQNMTDGINELADAEIAIIDAEIQVLEVLAAIEAMGEVTVDMDNNGISFEVGDMFKTDENGIIEFTDEMSDFLKQMQNAITTSDDLRSACERLKINGTSLKSLFEGSAATWEAVFGSAENASKFMQKLTTVDWADSAEDIQTQVINVLQSLGQDITVDVGENGLVGITAAGQIYYIDLDDKDIQKQAQVAVDKFKQEHPGLLSGDDLRDNIETLINSLKSQQDKDVLIDTLYTLRVATGEIKIEEVKDEKGNKKFVGEYGGVKFSADTAAEVETYIKRALDAETQGFTNIQFNKEAGTITGKIIVGGASIKIEYGKDGTPTITTEPPIPTDAHIDTSNVKEILKYYATQGYNENGSDTTFTVDGASYEVKTDNELGITYTYDITKDDYMYQGKRFGTKNDMLSYIRNVMPLEQGVYDDWELTENKGQKIWTKGSATITYDLSSSKVEIAADGITFKSLADCERYLAEKALADSTGGGTKDLPGGGQQITYKTEAGDFVVEYKSDGSVEYQVTLNNGSTIHSFTAHSEEEMKTGLAVATQINGGTVDNPENGGTITFTLDNGTFTVKVKENGTLELDGSSDKDAKEKGQDIVEQYNQKLQEGADNSTLSLDISKAITAGLTEAIPNLVAELQKIDSTPVTNLANAFTNVQDAISTIIESLTILNGLLSEVQVPTSTTPEDNGSPNQGLGSGAQEFEPASVPVEVDENSLTQLASDINSAISKVDATTTANELGIQVAQTISTAINTELQNLPSSIEQSGLKEPIAKIFESIGDNAAETFLKEFSTLATQLANEISGQSDQFKSAMQPAATGMSEALSDMDTKMEEATASIKSHWETLKTDITSGVEEIRAAIQGLQQHVSITWEIKASSKNPLLSGIVGNYAGWGSGTGGDSSPTGTPSNLKIQVQATLDTTLYDSSLETLTNSLNLLTQDIQKIALDADTKDFDSKATEVTNKLDVIKKGAQAAITADTETALQQLQAIVAELEKINSKKVTIDVTYKKTVEGSGIDDTGNDEGTGDSTPPSATGNVGLARAKGTLMGELGPELVVSNGRYFVAGQNGAEMVDLDDDAIVFNHLQTEQLLKKGMSNSRGKAVTSEKNAIAFATGNVNGGPAMASASAALSVLKQLKAMWESLKSASISDLAGAAGGGGGGGGSSGSSSDPSVWVDTVERWYNLTQEIAKLEKEITHQETLRSKLSSDWMGNGKQYYASQKKSLESLRDQIAAQEQLNLSRQAYYKQRADELSKTPFGKIMKFDEDGQMNFKKGAMEWLSDLVGQDATTWAANHTDEEKYNLLVKAGFKDYMKYDSNGAEIKMDSDNDGEITDDERNTFYSDATQAFWDRIDSEQSTMQSLWDSIEEGEESVLELQQQQNEIMEEIRENQMAVEDAVLGAIEDMKQREIDTIQDERDKLSSSAEKYVDGLTDALDKEKQMYENQESENDLNTKRRKLAILQRSGGSADEIASLQSEIESSEYDMYFDLQQQQIDAIQEASDLEISKLDTQIDIMTETLNYQKEYGLLWNEVNEVMSGSAEQIASFIVNGDSEYWNNSALATAKAINEKVFTAEQWTTYRDDVKSALKSTDGTAVGATAEQIDQNVQLMVTMTRDQMQSHDYYTFDQAMQAEFGKNYDKDGKYKELFMKVYGETGDITEASAAARKQYSKDKKKKGEIEEDKKEDKKEDKDKVGKEATIAGGDSGDGSGDACQGSCNAECTKTCGNSCKGKCQNSCKEKCNVGCKGTCTNGCEKTCREQCTETCMQECTTSCRDDCTTGCKNSCKDTCKDRCKETCKTTCVGESTKSIRGKASGGYVNHGIYELGELGTETVLTASQTKVLRDNILSNRPNSLVSLLKSYNESYEGINNPLSEVNPIEDNSCNIDNVQMTMEIKQISNDYDARRAGEQALNEMIRIARKSGAANNVRR